jgi:hypothetical protein
MVDAHQHGKLVEMEDERQLGITMGPVLLIHTMGAEQLTVLAIALQPGNLMAQRPLHMEGKMALLRDRRLPLTAKATPGALRHLLTKATAAVRIMSGAAIPRQRALGKATTHTMLLLLVRTSQLPRPQQ